nr:radical SAM protein [uncultured Oscillibacter sp.]
MKPYFSFQWHITDECDQRCKHCYIFSEDARKKTDAMTWEQMRDVVDNCCDMCEVYGRLPYFYITGGDPILHPDFWRLLALLKERGIPFTILGNPFRLNDEVCKRLKSYGCEKYQLSLRDFLYSVPDAFCCAENMVLMAAELGIASCIVARGEETFDSEEGAAMLREWGVPENYIARCFVLLGYTRGEYPGEKPRRPGRGKIAEG